MGMTGAHGTFVRAREEQGDTKRAETHESTPDDVMSDISMIAKTRNVPRGARYRRFQPC